MPSDKEFETTVTVRVRGGDPDAAWRRTQRALRTLRTRGLIVDFDVVGVPKRVQD